MKRKDFIDSKKRILNYLENNPGATIHKIKDGANVSINVIQRLKEDGLIVFRGYKMNVKYYLAGQCPVFI